MWAVILTVCSMNNNVEWCVSQNVETGFASQVECNKILPNYTEILPDGRWKSVEYECLIPNSVRT